MANRTMTQSLPTVQNNVLVKNKMITPHTSSDTEKELLQ